MIKKLEPYNPLWPQIFQKEAENIRSILQEDCLEIHHFGSTSIPNMRAKKDIDMLLVVKNLKSSLKLEQHGFVFKGELNIPLRYFFSKNSPFSKVNLHVCEQDHGFITLNLAFRDYLRTHPKDASEYQNVKIEAEKHPKAFEKHRGMLTFYGTLKNECIKNILKKAHYESLMVNFCFHDQEWKEYHRIKEEHIFKPIGVQYDPHHYSFSNPNHFHFCLYQGTEIVGIAHIEILDQTKAALRPICIDTPYQRKGLGQYLLLFLEKWLQIQGIKQLHLHADVNAIGFYLKQGYQFMPFNDPDGGLLSESKDMGKTFL